MTVVELAIEDEDAHRLEAVDSADGGAEFLHSDLAGDEAFGECEDFGAGGDAFHESGAEGRVDHAAAFGLVGEVCGGERSYLGGGHGVSPVFILCLFHGK